MAGSQLSQAIITQSNTIHITIAVYRHQKLVKVGICASVNGPVIEMVGGMSQS